MITNLQQNVTQAQKPADQPSTTTHESVHNVVDANHEFSKLRTATPSLSDVKFPNAGVNDNARNFEALIRERIPNANAEQVLELKNRMVENYQGKGRDQTDPESENKRASTDQKTAYQQATGIPFAEPTQEAHQFAARLSNASPTAIGHSISSPLTTEQKINLPFLHDLTIARGERALIAHQSIHDSNQVLSTPQSIEDTHAQIKDLTARLRQPRAQGATLAV